MGPEHLPEGATPRAEVAAWSGAEQYNRRLSIKARNMYCHWVDETTYQSIADTRDYTAPTAAG